MTQQKVMGAGKSSLIEHISWAPNLKRLWLHYVKMTPEKMNDLNSGQEEQKRIQKKQREEKKKVKKYDEIKFCFNYNLLKTWLA